ncbi:MAG TPA: hypothetical protein VK536_04890 [Candidatus Limnocylindrales bacterium]|nr:hypothetical protein [Candidatus Limnocylindrales bacterium]
MPMLNAKNSESNPPSKGYKDKTKRGSLASGEAGYCEEAINDLVKRMI